MPSGNDLHTQEMSISAAKAMALQGDECLGFTFEGPPGNPPDDAVVTVMFKSSAEWSPGEGWHTYTKTAAAPAPGPPPGPAPAAVPAPVVTAAPPVAPVAPVQPVVSPTGGSASLAKAKASREAAAARGKKIGTLTQKGGFISGAGGGFGHNAPGFGPKVTHWAGSKGSKRDVAIAPEVVSAWDLMLDDADPTTWMLANYDSTGKSIVLQSSGAGGLKAMQARLTDGKIRYLPQPCMSFIHNFY